LNSQLQQASLVGASSSTLRATADTSTGLVVGALAHRLVRHLGVRALGRIHSAGDGTVTGVLVVSNLELVENVIEVGALPVLASLYDLGALLYLLAALCRRVTIGAVARLVRILELAILLVLM